MSGHRLAERLAEVRPGTKVLYMSGYSEVMIENQAARGDEDNFIRKPFTPDFLARKVRQVLDHTMRAAAASGGQDAG
jgi:FixJ family two-component response regulator